MDDRTNFTPTATRETSLNADAHASPEAQLLIERVRQVARRVRRLMILRATALVIFVCFVAWLVAATLDFWVRNESPWFRWSMTALVIAAAIGGFVRWLRPVLRSQPTLVSTARRIELSLLQPNDRLSTTIDLLLDPRGDSASDLRNLAIAESARSLATTPIQETVDPLPTRRMLLMAGAVALCFGVTTALVPSMRLATERMSAPFRTLAWPAQDQLRLMVPEIVHQGSDLVIAVVDQAPPLPRDLRLQIRTPDSRQIDSLKASGLIAEQSRYQWTFPIEHEVEVRAVGGDDQRMAWQTIRMVERPMLKDHNVRIESPKYAQQPARNLTGFRFEVLSGSRVILNTTFSRSLQQVSLIDADSANRIPEAVSILSDDRKSVRFTFESMSSTQRVRIHWLDEHSLEGQTLHIWNFEVVADRPPEVEWLSPNQDLSVSSKAVIDLQWQAKDDVGVVKIEVKCAELPDELLPPPTVFETDASPPQRTAVANTVLSLADVESLHPGMTIRLHAIATDNAGQIADIERRISIVTSDAVDQLAADLLRQATAAMRQAISSQSIAASETLASQKMLLNDFRGAVDSAVRSQGAANQQLVGGPQAAKSLLDKASRHLNQNQVSLKSTEQLDRWSARIERVTNDSMRMAGEQLAQQADALPSTLKADSIVPAAAISKLGDINKLQTASLFELKAIIEEMSASDSARQAAFELSEIDRQQRRLNEQTTTAKNRGDIPPELAEQQRRLSRSAAEISHKLKLLDDDAANKAAFQLDKDGVATVMLEAASEIDQQKLDQAESSQHDIVNSLDAAAKALRGETESSKVDLDRWHEVVRSVTRIRDSQRQLVDGLSVEPVGELADRERQLADSTIQLSQQVDNQPAFKSVLTDAGRDMQTAAAGLARGRSEGIVRQAAADALQRLEAILAAAERANDDSHMKEPGDSESSATGEPEAGPSLETIQLWRNLQEWLHQETMTLNQQLGGNKHSLPELQQRRDRLADEQQKLGQAIGDSMQEKK